MPLVLELYMKKISRLYIKLTRKTMDEAVKTEQIIDNKEYTVQISSQGTSLTLKLEMKILKSRSVVYKTTLNSLSDIEKLAQQFNDIEELKQHIKDPKNIEVTLESKTIRIFMTAETKKNSRRFQIASLQLFFQKSIQNNPQEDLLDNILEKCSQNFELKKEVVKQLFESIGISFITQISLIKQELSKSQERIRALEQEVSRLKNEDVNGLSHRSAQIEKKLNQFPKFTAEKQASIHKKLSQLEKYVHSLFSITSWIDLDYAGIKKLELKGRRVTAKETAHVFGLNKLTEQYTFTAYFSKMKNFAAIGVIDTQNRVSREWKNKNFVYYTNFGQCRVGNDNYFKGSGFRKGQKVEVVINMKLASIQWRVGTEIRHKQTIPMLLDENITWVPYIWLLNSGDSAEIGEE